VGPNKETLPAPRPSLSAAVPYPCHAPPKVVRWGGARVNDQDSSRDTQLFYPVFSTRFSTRNHTTSAMANISAKWTRLASSTRLQRSSQCVSVLGAQAWIFGGELLARQPVDNQLDVIELDPEQGIIAFSDLMI
jgi:hypothetical protein